MKALKIILLAAVVLAGCGPRRAASAPQKSTREFPAAQIPAMITDPLERTVWATAHFWDAFTSTEKLYYCDSLTVNGVSIESLEQQMGLFSSLLQQVPLPDGQHAMTALLQRLEAFQEAHPEGNVFKETSALVSHYFYDPNSPVRSEDLYLPFVKGLAASAYIDPAYKMGYEWDAKMCALNRIGTPAADFVFIDTAGKKGSLYGIKAEYTLLIFGNPDCHACKELLEQMESSPAVNQMIMSKRLKVVDIYIDEDIPLWKERMATYPAAWINGYDPSFTIRTNLTYNVRALPSLYLLDAAKTVLLKDALPDQVLEYLSYASGQ